MSNLLKCLGAGRIIVRQSEALSAILIGGLSPSFPTTGQFAHSGVCKAVKFFPVFFCAEFVLGLLL